MIFKIKTQIRRFFSKLFNFNRPTSYPFISVDGFRALAQHVFDELSDINPEKVEKNDIVFVRTDFLIEFFEKKHPHIKNKYILLSGNVDTNVEQEYKKYDDEKIIHWFAQNLDFKTEKVTPLPIGITNYHYVNTLGKGKIDVLLKNINLKDSKNKIKDKISFGFNFNKDCMIPRSLERMALDKKLNEDKNFERVNTVDQDEYFKKLNQYYFTVSPEGAGIDCYRTWEAMYLGIVPIVKRSTTTEYLKGLNLPIILVSDWNEMDKILKNGLPAEYDKLKAEFNNKAIYMGYWMDQIASKRIK
jgi:hypothetical protein